jgi:spore coat protein U-like protein
MKSLGRWPLVLRLTLLLFGLCCGSQVRAVCTLGCSCNVSTTSVAFAAYNPLATANTDSAGNVRVNCGGGAGLLILYTIAIGPGISNSAAARTMASGAARLAYNLYTSNTYTTIWGDGSGTGAVVNGGILLDVLGSSGPQDFPVYGRIPGRQASVAPGAYSDTVVVTLTYF